MNLDIASSFRPSDRRSQPGASQLARRLPSAAARVGGGRHGPEGPTTTRGCAARRRCRRRGTGHATGCGQAGRQALDAAANPPNAERSLSRRLGRGLSRQGRRSAERARRRQSPGDRRPRAIRARATQDQAPGSDGNRGAQGWRRPAAGTETTPESTTSGRPSGRRSSPDTTSSLRRPARPPRATAARRQDHPPRARGRDAGALAARARRAVAAGCGAGRATSSAKRPAFCRASAASGRNDQKSWKTWASTE